MPYKRIKTDSRNKIGIICLNNPENLNIIESDTFDEINSALNLFENDKNIKVVLIKADCGTSKAGKKVFSAGVNLKEYSKKFEIADKNPYEFKISLINNREILTRIEKYNKPVIIGIDGIVVGGFFELALACDLILASEKASFRLSEVSIGLIPGYGGISRLLKIAGKNKTFEIVSTGREISPDEALNIGIVSEIFDDSVFEEEILNYCGNLAEKSSNSLYLTKKTIHELLKNPETEEIETKNFLKAIMSEDSREGVNAFLEKASIKSP